jgi:sigma-B regulation protein RsbU (phosphoserine phosphatase)
MRKYLKRKTSHHARSKTEWLKTDTIGRYRELAITRFQSPPPGRSGDFLTCSVIGDSIIVCVGDVEGHDRPAARLSRKIRRFLRMQRGRTAPADTLSLLSDLLFRWRSPRFVSAIAASIDAQTARLTYSSAGHHPPLRISGGQPAWMMRGGPLLGVVRDARYSPVTCTLGPGDSVIFVTDGLVDVKAQRGGRLGDDQFFSLVQKHQHLGAEALATALLQDIGRFGTLTDDATLCVVQHVARTPVSEGRR